MKGKLIYWLNLDSKNFQFILYGLVLATLIVIEIIIPLRKQNISRRRRWPTKFGITFLNILLLGALPVSFLSVSLYANKRCMICLIW
jgi:hypothetical protein